MVSAIGYADPMSTDDDTRPITYAEALTVTRATLDAASTVSVLITYSPTGTERDSSVAKQCRAAADFLEAMYEATKPADILRRAADQIDPSTVPAEPDLTTADGWSALASEEADAGGQLPAIGSAEECAAAATARRCFDHSGAGWSLLTEALADWASTRLPR